MILFKINLKASKVKSIETQIAKIKPAKKTEPENCRNLNVLFNIRFCNSNFAG